MSPSKNNQKATVSGWGNYPVTESRVSRFQSETSLQNYIRETDEFIPFGNGRSYGDSALSANILKINPHHYFLDFDKIHGSLHVQAGVMLSEILDVIIQQGWFLKITPGTRFITVGGAIASDVHGKNHHIAGCFSESVEMFHLMLPDGRIVECSKQKNTDLFHATCGGMGLTGVILDARISLLKINSSHINQTTVKTRNLEETFQVFHEYKDSPYSVAWIDCLSSGRETGKSLFMAGEFSDDGDIDYRVKNNISVPFYFPAFVLNTYTVKAFNYLYYKKVRQKISEQTVDIDAYFYPLDNINSWNRIYGRKGFLQYQIVLPLETSKKGLEQILRQVSASGKGSFLAVLKLFGKANSNWLSFPMEGYSLALDFKIENGLFKLLDALDEIVLQHGGRHYLAKDARLQRKFFERGYPKVGEFRALRKKYGMDTVFNSFQSRRLDL